MRSVDGDGARPSASAWTRSDVIAGVLLLAAAVWVTWPVWQDIARLAWNDEESSHVFLSPVAVIWTAWVRRHRLARCGARGRWAGAVVVAGGCVAWWMGDRFDRISMWYGGAVLMVAGSLLTILGTDVLRQFAPSVVALLFAMPAPALLRQRVSLPLQAIAVEATRAVCEVTGMDVHRAGNTLVYNGVNVGIAEACNGLRMICTLAVVCYTFAFITPVRAWVRAAILLAIPVVAVVANVVRLVATVWVFGRAPMKTAETFHDAAGWVMLVLAFVCLTAVVRVFRWAGVPVDVVDASAAATNK